MKLRRRQVVLGAAALVAVLVAALVVTHWGTVRDHVEAWHFQLTRETETIELASGMNKKRPRSWYTRLSGEEAKEHVLSIAAKSLRCPVIFDPWDMPPPDSGTMSGKDMRELLEARGYRFLEQRFPRRAYVVIHDPRPVLALPIEEREPPGCPFPREERP